MTAVTLRRTGTWRSSSPRRRTRVLMIPAVAMTALIAVLVGVVVTDLVTRGNGRSSQAGEVRLKSQVLAYESAILPIVRDVGSIEVYGMRAGLRDVKSAAPAALVQTQAWAAGLDADARKLAAISAPPSLAPAHLLFRQCVAILTQAAHVFEQAARAAAGKRHPLLMRGIALGERADRVYDEASVILQSLRARVGLPATPDFPRQ